MSTPPTPKQSRGCFIPFYLLASFLFCCLFYLGNAVYKSQISKSWTPTEATIIDAFVDSSVRKATKVSKTKAVYTYEVDGTTYQSNRVSFFNFGKSNVRNGHRSLTDAKRVLVYVNPDNPQDSTISTGISHSFAFLLWFLVILFFITYCYYRFLYEEPVSKRTLGVTLFFIWCYGMAHFQFRWLPLENSKITILEKREIVEIKPPEELIRKDFMEGMTNNKFKKFVDLKATFKIKVLSVTALFGNQKQPYNASVQFTYTKDGVSETFIVSMVYVKKGDGWEVHSYDS